jgi:hypothetical protein
MTQNVVTINGKKYDSLTGMPIEENMTPPIPEAASTRPSLPKVHTSQAMHRAMQKSQTLNRRIVKKQQIAPAISPLRKDMNAPQRTIQKSPAITKFAAHPNSITPRKATDIGPVAHPLVTSAQKRLQQPSKQLVAEPKPAQVIKQEAITKALDEAPSHSKNHQQIKRSKRYPRVLSIASMAMALLLLGGYFTYLNMPSLSVRVAAAQAGINASYPSYHPDGYSLNGPVAYAQGEVMMKFAANAGPQNFTVTQTKSSWDSSAVLDNYVKQKAGDNYIAYDEHGLTIYTYGGNAAWVNGGILYTISGDAPLSSDQIRHIATSM